MKKELQKIIRLFRKWCNESETLGTGLFQYESEHFKADFDLDSYNPYTFNLTCKDINHGEPGEDEVMLLDFGVKIAKLHGLWADDYDYVDFTIKTLVFDPEWFANPEQDCNIKVTLTVTFNLGR